MNQTHSPEATQHMVLLALTQPFTYKAHDTVAAFCSLECAYACMSNISLHTLLLGTVLTSAQGIPEKLRQLQHSVANLKQVSCNGTVSSIEHGGCLFQLELQKHKAALSDEFELANSLKQLESTQGEVPACAHCCGLISWISRSKQQYWLA